MTLNLRYRKVVFYLYAIGLLMLAVLPINSHGSNTLNNQYVVHIRLDHLLHGITLFPWAILGNWAMPAHRGRVIFSGLIAAILLECIQYFLSYRSFNINDMIYNLIGMILGSIAFIRLK